MPNDLTVGPNQARAMRDLQDDYDSRKQDIQQDNERKLRQLQSSYRKKEDEIVDTGEATVNHIRRSTDRNIKDANEQSETKIEHENEALTQNYQDLKRRGQQQLRSLEGQIEEHNTNVENNIQGLKQKEAMTIKSEQEKLGRFLKEEEVRKVIVNKTANEQIQREQKNAAAQIMETQKSSSSRVQNLEQEQRSKLTALKNETDELYGRTKSEGHKRVADAQHEGETNLEQARHDYNRQLSTMQKKYHDETTSEQQKGQTQLTELEKNDQRKYADKAKQDADAEKQLGQNFVQETNRVNLQGEKTLTERQDGYRKKLDEQKAINEQKLQATQQKYQEKDKKLHQGYDERLATNDKIYKGNLKEQRDEFALKFGHDGETFHSSLENQKEGYLKALYKQQEKLASRADLYSKRESDPFYSFRDLNAKLHEYSHSFVLKAQVPDYERDKVEIQVQDDKVIISTKRSFEDKFDDKDGKVATNNYQSFRQEFRLDFPVAKEKVIKRIDKDGGIEVIIPKRNFDKSHDIENDII